MTNAWHFSRKPGPSDSKTSVLSPSTQMSSRSSCRSTNMDLDLFLKYQTPYDFSILLSPSSIQQQNSFRHLPVENTSLHHVVMNAFLPVPRLFPTFIIHNSQFNI